MGPLRNECSVAQFNFFNEKHTQKMEVDPQTVAEFHLCVLDVCALPNSNVEKIERVKSVLHTNFFGAGLANACASIVQNLLLKLRFDSSLFDFVLFVVGTCEFALSEAGFRELARGICFLHVPQSDKLHLVSAIMAHASISICDCVYGLFMLTVNSDSSDLVSLIVNTLSRCEHQALKTQHEEHEALRYLELSRFSLDEKSMLKQALATNMEPMVPRAPVQQTVTPFDLLLRLFAQLRAESATVFVPVVLGRIQRLQERCVRNASEFYKLMCAMCEIRGEMVSAQNQIELARALITNMVEHGITDAWGESVQGLFRLLVKAKAHELVEFLWDAMFKAKSHWCSDRVLDNLASSFVTASDAISLAHSVIQHIKMYGGAEATYMVDVFRLARGRKSHKMFEFLKSVVQGSKPRCLSDQEHWEIYKLLSFSKFRDVEKAELIDCLLQNQNG